MNYLKEKDLKIFPMNKNDREGICSGEKYTENDNGGFRHFECFKELKELLTWLGYDVKMKQ